MDEMFNNVDVESLRRFIKATDRVLNEEDRQQGRLLADQLRVRCDTLSDGTMGFVLSALLTVLRDADHKLSGLENVIDYKTYYYNILADLAACTADLLRMELE